MSAVPSQSPASGHTPGPSAPSPSEGPGAHVLELAREVRILDAAETTLRAALDDLAEWVARVPEGRDLPYALRDALRGTKEQLDGIVRERDNHVAMLAAYGHPRGNE